MSRMIKNKDLFQNSFVYIRNDSESKEKLIDAIYEPFPQEKVYFRGFKIFKIS